MNREWKLHEAIRHIRGFVGNISLGEFLANEKTRSAVAFKIENIGEAAKNIPRAIRTKYRGLPWADMARMRDKITHSYFGIDYKIVWKVVKEELPTIEPSIEKILNDLKAGDSLPKNNRGNPV